MSGGPVGARGGGATGFLFRVRAWAQEDGAAEVHMQYMHNTLVWLSDTLKYQLVL